MKKQIAIWTLVIVLVGGGLFVLSRLSTSASTSQSLPSYSLVPGPMGMTGGAGYYDISATGVISTDQVVAAVQRYLTSQNNPDLALARLREFRWAYQVEIVERSTGRHAYGLMVSAAAAQVSPKAGPNVFWNTKYGSLIAEIGGGYGMLGRMLSTDVSGEMTVTAQQARNIAEKAVKGLDASLTLDDTTDTFYGFYEFQVAKEGKLVGEVDVNGYSGQVWYKDWGEPQLSTQDLQSSR